MPFMYILLCSDGSYYTGSTCDLNRRLEEHQIGMGSEYTRNRTPVKLVYCEEYDRIEDAYHRERQIHGWTRRKKQALIEGELDSLVAYSKSTIIE
jgi:putative endonuclease